MAIIYSYPETTQILLTDMLIGTSTIRIAGKKKNLTKNFTIETLGLFIQDNFPTATPSLNQVLTVGNTSLLNAKIGQLYLYDTSELDYGHIALADSGYDLYNALGGLIARIEGVGIVLQGPAYNSQILTGTITANRAYTLPNATGTIALTSDIPTKTSDLINDGEDGINPFITAADIPPSASTLNDVLTNGNTSLLDAKVGTLGLWDTINSYYNKLGTLGNTFYYQLNSGANIFAVSPSSLNLNNGTATLEIINPITATRTLYWPDATGTIALTSDIPTALTFTSPLIDTLGTITIDQSNTTTDGYLSSTDWNTFNDKQDVITLTTTGSSGVATFIANTLNIPNYSTDLSGYVPYTGATSDVDLGLFDITASHLIKDGGVSTQFLKADGSVDNNIYLTSADLPATLDLFATTYASDIPGYSVLVRNITDSRFNTVAVDVSTGVITTTAQLVGSLISDANTISGNPGIFNITTIGNISRTSETGQAEFFFRVYKRDNLGIETFITESSKTLPVTNGGYTEFSATALWNDGIFLNTDRVVIKYYADRLTSPVGI